MSTHQLIFKKKNTKRKENQASNRNRSLNKYLPRSESHTELGVCDHLRQ